jgi:hypothetical protein
VLVEQRFLRNQYLYLVVVAGMLAPASLLVLRVSTLRASVLPRHDGELQACGVGLLMVMLSSVVVISLSTRKWIPAIAVVSACVALIAASLRPLDGQDVA